MTEPEDPATAVAVGYVFEDEIKASFFHSFVGLFGHDAEHSGRVWRGGLHMRRGTTGDLAAGRNGVISDFLESDRADWLWWIDTDMGFAPDTVDRLFEAADPTEKPVVGALCFAQREHESDGAGGWRPVAWPTVMDWSFHEGRGGFEVRWDYPRETVTRCTGTGSACILVHRSVFERIRDDYEEAQRRMGRRAEGDPRWDGWYTRVTNPSTGELMGEDLSFCARLMQLEIPLHVHTGVQTTHQKHIWLQEQDYWRQRALSAPPETVEPIPTDERAVHRYAVVPTHNRPARLLALVSSLSRQADTIVVLDNASDPPTNADALRAAAKGVSVHVMHEPEQPPHLSRYWNNLLDLCSGLAKAAGQEAWDVAVFNDDAIVPAGWYDTVSVAMREHPTAVVAHTGATPVHELELRTEVNLERSKRMCPWAFVTAGEAGLRADESMRWWYFDDDFDRLARQAGGVLAVPGPIVVNANAVESTVGALAEQAEADCKTFDAKWTAPTCTYVSGLERDLGDPARVRCALPVGHDPGHENVYGDHIGADA